MRSRLSGQWPMFSLLLLIAITGRASGSQDVALPDSASAQADTEFPVMEPVEEKPKNVLIPLPIIAYAPETKLALGASVVYIYRTGNADPDSRPSTFGALGIYTLNSQVLATLGGDHYWDEDRQKFSGGVFYQKFPNDFYGIGNDTDADFTEGYTDEGASFSADYIREVFPRIRLGGGVSYGGSSITGTDPGDLLSDDLIPGSGGGQIVGAGLSVSYDSRKNISYPQSATFGQLSWRLYDKALGGDFILNTTTLDLRRYFHLGAKRVWLSAASPTSAPEMFPSRSCRPWVATRSCVATSGGDSGRESCWRYRVSIVDTYGGASVGQYSAAWGRSRTRPVSWGSIDSTTTMESDYGSC